MWIDILHPTTGALLGGGPIHTATDWQFTYRLDEAGSFSFTMPAGDPKSVLVQNRRVARARSIEDGETVELGAGVIDSVEVQPGDPTLLRVSGPDLLAELAARTIVELNICEQEETYLTDNPVTLNPRGAVRWLYDRYGTTADIDLEQAYDGDVDTGGDTIRLWREADIYADWLYVGADTRFDYARIYLGSVNDREATLVGQYFDGTGWETLPALVDGTSAQNGALENCTFKQNGNITWTRPTDWTRTAPTQNTGNWFWVRFTNLSGQYTDDFILREVMVYADVPTTGGIDLIMAYAPATWVQSGYPATTGEKYLEIRGESVLAALKSLIAQGTVDADAVVREHFYLPLGLTRELEWFTAFVDSGYRAVPATLDAAGQAGVCLISQLSERTDTAEVITRLYPLTNESIPLHLTTRSAPTGYTLSTTDGYLEHNAGITAYGRIEATYRFTDISLQQNDSWYEHPAMAADALFDRALEYLRTHGTEQQFYTLDVLKAGDDIRPGHTMRVTYHEWRQGAHVVDIDADLYVTGVTLGLAGDNIHTVGLEVATIDRQPQTDTGVLVQTVQDVRRQAKTAGGTYNLSIKGSQGTVTAPVTLGDLPLNATLLRADTDLYPGVYAADIDGLTAALAAAVTGDTVDLATAIYTGDVTIGAGITVRGRGGSIIAGTVTLGAGSVLDGVTVEVSGASATALVGVYGPESGEGLLHKCTVTVANAGGDAYGVVARGGDLVLRECHVQVEGDPDGYGVATSGVGDMDVYDGEMIGSTDNAITEVTL